MESKRISTRTLVGVALFTAIVFVLQMFGSTIHLGPFSITLTLIPIVVGAALYGSWAGAWLGFVFSMVVLFTDSQAFMVINPIGTIITVLVKGTAAGFLAGFVYRCFEKKNDWLSAVLAAVTAPVVNTGLFLIGCVLFFLPTVSEWGRAAGFENVGLYMVTVFVGLNFLVELAVNLVLSPVIVRLIKIGRKDNH